MAKNQEPENAKPAQGKDKKRNKSAKTSGKKSAPRAGGAQQDKAKRETVKSARPKGTPPASRRKRSDGVAAAVEIAQAAMRGIEPPAHVRLKKRDYPFFDSIIAEFAKVEWTDHTLELAALLARAISDLEMEQDMMRREGSILKNIKLVPIEPGNPDAGEKEVVTGTYVNPRKQIIDMHSKNILAWRRSLSLHARVKDGEPRETQKRRADAKKIENGIADLDDKMNLIARPSMVQ
jgi:hypothetical protein